MEYRPGGGESVSHGGAGKSVSRQEKSGESTEQGKREWRKIREVTRSQIDRLYIVWSLAFTLSGRGSCWRGNIWPTSDVGSCWIWS